MFIASKYLSYDTVQYSSRKPPEAQLISVDPLSSLLNGTALYIKIITRKRLHMSYVTVLASIVRSIWSEVQLDKS